MKILAVCLLAMSSVDGGTFMDGGVYYVSQPPQVFSTGPAASAPGYSHPPIAIQFGSSMGAPVMQIHAPEEPTPVRLAVASPGDRFSTGSVSGGPAVIPEGTTGGVLSGGSAVRFPSGGQTGGVSGGSAADQFVPGGQNGGLSGGSAFPGSQIGGGSAADQFARGGQLGGLGGGSALQGSQMGGPLFQVAAAAEPTPPPAAGPAPGRTEAARIQAPYPYPSMYDYGVSRTGPHHAQFYY